MCWLVVGALCRGADDLLLRVGQLPRERGRISGERGLTENRLLVALGALSSGSALWEALAGSLHLGPGGREQRWEVSDVDRLH